MFPTLGGFMKYIAYHRTITLEQHLGHGVTEITLFFAENPIPLYKGKVYCNQQTGKNFNRPWYQILKNEIFENGDTLIITELDRLGRNKKLILDELRFFHDNNVRVMVFEIPITLIDFSKFDNSIFSMMHEAINNMLSKNLCRCFYIWFCCS